jgi:hypothetical protein
MNINELFPSRFVKGEDIGENRPTLAIKVVTIEEMGKDKEKNPVIWFEGAKKGLVLNKTNAVTIGSLYGPETNNWAGKRITLFTVKERHFGEMHHVIKVVPTVPPDPQPKQQTVMSTPQPALGEARRNYLKKIVELSTQHDSLFEESTDITDLKQRMADAEAEGERIQTMPTVPAAGKSQSMYSYLLELIDDAVEMGDMGEAVLSYLLGRVVSGVTPPDITCRFLLDDLMGEKNWVDALITCAFIINENVELP